MLKISCLAYPDLTWVCEDCLSNIADVARYTILNYKDNGKCQKCGKRVN